MITDWDFRKLVILDITSTSTQYQKKKISKITETRKREKRENSENMSIVSRRQVNQ